MVLKVERGGGRRRREEGGQETQPDKGSVEGGRGSAEGQG